MRIVVINGCAVEITSETFKRIERIATARKISISEAIIFCLEKVI